MLVSRRLGVAIKSFPGASSFGEVRSFGGREAGCARPGVDSCAAAVAGQAGLYIASVREPMASDIDKTELLADLGYAGPLPELEQALQEAGLSSERKRRISSAKRDEVQALLVARFLRVCPRGDCKRGAQELLVRRPGVRLAEASAPEQCELCHGSAIGAEIDRMLASCAKAGWSCLCVVRGSPNARTRLEAELAGRLELRLVDGMRSRTRQQARTDLAWADYTVIWGPTLLEHKVSNLYSGATCGTVRRRGIENLVRHVTERAAGQSR